MTLFFKHLLHSIKRKPLQPLVLILTLTLSIFVLVSSLSIKNSLTEEAQLSMEAQYGSADFMVALNSSSKARFMFTKDAKELLGDRARVVGTYEIILTEPKNEATIFAIASDFYEIGDVFDLSFTSYGGITKEGLPTTALITESFAKENDLCVGDSFNVRLFSEDITYTVGGISPQPYLGKYNVMVDITGVVRALASRSIIASALGESFKPSSTLYIDVNDGYTISECTNILKENSAFSEKSFTDTGTLLKSQSNVDNLNITIDISIILVCLLSMAVAFCCFFILANERYEENLSFTIAGASVAKLNTLQYLEVILYWIVGTILGIALSVGAIKPVYSFIGLRYAQSKISPDTVLISALIILFASLITVTIFILDSYKKRKAYTKSKLFVVFPAIIALVLMVLEFIIPPTFRVAIGTAITVLVLLLTFTLAPALLKFIMRHINNALDKRVLSGNTRGTHIRYAIKNLYSVKALHNASRLIAILIAVVTLATIIIVSSHNNIRIAKSVFNSEYAILGATERCSERISECEEIESLESAYFSTTILKNNISSTLLSVSNIDILSSTLNITELPCGNEAIISRSVAKSLSIKVGDSLFVNCDNKEIELKIKKIQSSPMTYVLFDREEAQIQSNLLIPVFKENVDSNEALNVVSTAIAEDVAVISRMDSIMKEKTETISIYLACGDILLSMIIIFSIIGLLDSLYNSYRTRREEFKLYATSGMSSGGIAKLKTWEIIISLVFGVALGILCALVIIPFMNESMSSFGTELLANLFAKC